VSGRLAMREVSACYYWLAAIDKAAFLGSFFGKLPTGTNTPFEISSEHRAFFLRPFQLFCGFNFILVSLLRSACLTAQIVLIKSVLAFLDLA
jgi:hypothetical protein